MHGFLTMKLPCSRCLAFLHRLQQFLNNDEIGCHAGPSISSPLLAQYCGKRTPNPLVSFSNYLTVRLVTDKSVGYTGFNATYQQGLLQMFITFSFSPFVAVIGTTFVKSCNVVVFTISKHLDHGNIHSDVA